MTMKLKVSLLALYDYDNALFEYLHLPEGADGEQIINNLLMETMDMDVLYTDPAFMKRAIGIWSQKKMEEWQLLYDALNIEYAPLDNYDRYEDITETRDLTYGKDLADDHTETRNLASGGSVNNSTAAYDSNTLQAKDASTVTGSDTGTVRNAGTETGETTEGGTVRRAGRIHGNIGVTTSTQMLRDYIDYRGKVCFDDIVINDFINQFIRLIY